MEDPNKVEKSDETKIEETAGGTKTETHHHHEAGKPEVDKTETKVEDKKD